MEERAPKMVSDGKAKTVVEIRNSKTWLVLVVIVVVAVIIIVVIVVNVVVVVIVIVVVVFAVGRS